MFRSICLVFCLFLASVVSGQTGRSKNPEAGFYGKRFTFQLGAGGHHNTLLKLAGKSERYFRKNDYYDTYRSKIRNDAFNYSLYANLGVVLRENLSFSVDVQYYYGTIFFRDLGTLMHDAAYGGGYYFTGEFDSRVRYNTVRFMPRLEFASAGSNMPAGLVHIIGIGVELSRLKSGNYTCIDAYSYGRSLPPDSVHIADHFLQLGTETAVNITWMYGLEYRLPLSKNLAWNFGGYLHVNLPALFPSFIDETDYYYDSTEQKRQLALYRFQNIFSVRTGLVIML